MKLFTEIGPDLSRFANVKHFGISTPAPANQFNKVNSVSLIVNNLLGDIRKDSSASWPYYPVGYYLLHGRQGWIEFNHVCGS